jgi:outer membrane lipoprotein-sorting protein
MKQTARMTLLFLLLFPGPLPAAGAQDDGRRLVTASEERTKSTSERATWRMELLDRSGKKVQERQIEIFFKRSGGEESTLQKFLSPPVVAGTGILIVDRGEAVNDIWLYLPATRRLRRISGAEKSNWYMGTELTYEDFEDYQIPFYSFSSLGERPCGERRRCQVVEAIPSTPGEKSASGYSKKVYWLDGESLYPLRVDFYAKSGKLAKQLTVSGLERAGRYFRPGEVVMSNLENGRKTRLVLVHREIDQPLDDYYVSQRYLREE